MKREKHSGKPTDKKNYINKKAVSLALLGAVCFSAVLSVSVLTKNVKVTDGTEEIVVSTMNLSTDAILEKAGITLGDNDKVVYSDDGEGNIEVSVLRAFNVDITADGETTTVSVVDGTVEDALEATGMTLGDNDKISYSLSTALESDMEIKIARYYTLNVNDGGDETSAQVPQGTVEDALEFLGITLGDDDIMNYDLEDEVEEGMTLVIRRITYEDVTETSSIAYETVYEESDSLYVGETEVQTEGVDGVLTTKIRRTYINGELSCEETLSSTVTKEAVDEVILEGTKEKVSMIQTNSGNIYDNETSQILTDADGNQVSYSQVLTGTGTAYTASEGAVTSTGLLAQYGVVAVDPDVIPYGSKLYIVSADGQIVYGYAVAGDTGGAMLSGRVLCDLYYPSYSDCTIFGKRDIIVYVLS